MIFFIKSMQTCALSTHYSIITNLALFLHLFPLLRVKFKLHVHVFYFLWISLQHCTGGTKTHYYWDCWESNHFQSQRSLNNSVLYTLPECRGNINFIIYEMRKERNEAANFLIRLLRFIKLLIITLLLNLIY